MLNIDNFWASLGTESDLAKEALDTFQDNFDALLVHGPRQRCDPCCKTWDFSILLADFLWRRHVACPFQIILILFAWKCCTVVVPDKEKFGCELSWLIRMCAVVFNVSNSLRQKNRAFLKFCDGTLPIFRWRLESHNCCKAAFSASIYS